LRWQNSCVCGFSFFFFGNLLPTSLSIIIIIIINQIAATTLYPSDYLPINYLPINTFTNASLHSQSQLLTTSIPFEFEID
jgi:hypothetical protein